MNHFWKRDSNSRQSSSAREMVDFITRKAINGSTTVGGLYNAINDSYVSNISLMKIPSSTAFYKSAHCELIRGDDPRCDDLLKMIGIDGELWISLSLNTCDVTETASIVNASFPIDKNTRFLHYYYSKEEKYIFKDRNLAMRNISETMPDNAATHIATATTFGIEALIVLQLSSDDETEFDKLLNKINESLINKNFHLEKAEAQLLNQIKLIKVFSNIADLRKMTKITEICKKIIELTSRPFNYRPLECTFYPIKWFYPSYSSRKAKYVPLSSEHIDKIKQYLISLSMKRKHQAISVDPQIEKTLNEHLENKFNQVRQEMKEVEKLYSSQIQQIRDLVIKMRSGKAQEQKMAEIMVDESEKSWQEKSNSIKRYFQALTKKAEMIIDYDQQGIKYMNMEQLSVTPDDDLYSIFEKNFSRDKATLLFCSTDELKDQNCDLWINHHQKWIEELQNNPSNTLVFADFSYSSFCLSEIKIFSSKSQHQAKDKCVASDLPTSSAANVHSLNEQSEKGEEEMNSTRLSEAPERKDLVSCEDRDVVTNETITRPESLNSLTTNTLPIQQYQPKHNKEPLHSSISPTQSHTRFTSSAAEEFNILRKSTDISVPSASSISASIQNENLSVNINATIDSLEVTRRSSTENLATAKEETEQIGDELNVSKSRTFLTVQSIPQPKPRSSVVQQSSTLKTSLEPLTIDRVHKSANEQEFLSKHLTSLEL